MISPDQYVPILKCKRGEFRALVKLPASVLDKIVPVIDLVPPQNLNAFRKQKKTKEEYQEYLEKYFTVVLDYFRKYWQKQRLLYIDGYMIQDLGLLKNDVHPIEYMFNNLLPEGFNILPVIGNSTGSYYNDVVKKIILDLNLGAGLRVFRLTNTDFNVSINELLNYLGILPEDLDLIIDLRSLEGVELNQLLLYTENRINQLSYLDSWRSFVLSGTVFPVNLSDIAADQIYLLPRIEWQNWQQSVQNKRLDRIPSYSDYGISHPKILAYDTDYINMSASIRYTGNENFYIYRGRGTRQHGFEQFFDLSEMLISRPEYCGRKHCFGDNQIFNCGTEKVKTGNPETWRLIGTNHHITKVTDQLHQFFLNFNV